MANNSEQDRRLVVVPVSIDLLINLMRQDYVERDRIECVAGLPADAVLVGAREDPMANSVRFLFYHPSFAPVPEGEWVPLRQITLRRYSAYPLDLAPNTVPALAKALVDSMDKAQAQALQKLLVLVGSRLPDDARAGPLAEELAKGLTERVYAEAL